MKKKGILIVLLVLALILAAGSMFTVAEDEYACTVRFSKIIDTTSEAGLHFKLPFVDSVKYFTDATQLYDIPPSEVLMHQAMFSLLRQNARLYRFHLPQRLSPWSFHCQKQSQTMFRLPIRRENNRE